MARSRTSKRAAAGDTPKRRTCGCMQVHFRLLEEHPEFRRRQVDLQHAYMARMRVAAAARTTPYKITVVVHVVHNTAAQKIKAAQVNSQITVLNRDFRAKNPDRNNTPSVWKGLVADAMVEFELATN